MAREPVPDRAVTARATLLSAYYQARDSGDAEATAAAALDLPSSQFFGTHPGPVPALIHEAYTAATEPAVRCRLAAALARAWVYGGDAPRAVPFAREAVTLAGTLSDPMIAADALDAALVAHWGPDELPQRLSLAARLADTTAHLASPAPRLAGHLWRLTTAWECLDLVAVQRQLRALDALAAESDAPRDAFFATSRRAMYALTIGDLDTADRLIADTAANGAAAAEPDLDAVVHSLVADRARQRGDVAALRAQAAAFDAYGAAEGVPSVSAEAAVLWHAAGVPDRAQQLLHQIGGPGLDTVPRDVDFLLTVTCLIEVAARLHRDGIRCADLLTDGVRLLTPFAGRAVLNAGAVAFHGVVDDYLHQAEQALAAPDAIRWRHSAASAYQRLGARWWCDRLKTVPEPTRATAPTTTVHWRPKDDGNWIVGTSGHTTVLPDLRGLHYVRELLRRPGTDISALDLSAAAEGHGRAVVTETDTSELVDKRALAAYRQRLADIDSELEEAESWTDQGRVNQLRHERDALLAEVRTATGLGGRRRRFSSTHERARVAVRKAITASLERLDRENPGLGRLLRDTIRTGANCRYDPDDTRPVTWILDQPVEE